MQTFWNFEQLLGLSPDHFTIRSGQGNAKIKKWLTIGAHEQFLWGEYNNKTRPPYQVSLDFTQMHFSCNCLGKKFPCQHIIGLHLLWHYHPEQFEPQAVPKWVRAYQTRFLQQLDRIHHTEPVLIDPKGLSALQNGLGELERWLHDLVQNGLAALPDKPKAYWSTIANRMADVQATALSHYLLELSQIGQSQPDWPETYLRRLSPLAMLVMGFKRFEQQPLNVQADMLAATGRPLPAFDTGHTPLFDQWLVLGHRSETISQQQQLITWLWGLNHHQMAQTTQILQGKHPNGVQYITGSVLSGEMQYAVGTVPLEARFTTRPIVRKAPRVQLGDSFILDGMSIFLQARVKNPWLQRFPLLFSGLTPVFENGRWFLLDVNSDSLPLPEKFNYGWHLHALASQGALTVFGLWNGSQFEPMSAYIDENWVDLHAFRGIK